MNTNDTNIRISRIEKEIIHRANNISRNKMSKVLGLIAILFFVVSSCEKSEKVKTDKKEKTVFKGESIHKSLGSIKRAKKTVNKLNERVKSSEKEIKEDSSDY